MFVQLCRWLVVAAAGVSASACTTAPSTIDAQWVNPDFAGKREVRSVLVMSAVRDTTARRVFEDRMVSALAGAGVKAIQSYKFIAQDGPVAEDALRHAVAQAGVTHAMVTRINNISTQVNVSPGMVMGPAWGPGWGWGGFAGYYNAMWATSVPPTFTTTRSVLSDTRLVDARDAVVLWSAATTTATGYNQTPQIIDQFVQLIVAALTKDGII